MTLTHGTSRRHRKLRSIAVLLLMAAAALMLPAIASAQVTVSAYPVTLDTAPVGSNSTLEPAIAPAPDGANAEWFVVERAQPERDLGRADRTAGDGRQWTRLRRGHAGHLCECRRRRLRLDPRQRPGSRQRAVCRRGLRLNEPRAQPGRPLRRLRPGHDARAGRRALHRRQRRDHQVPDHAPHRRRRARRSRFRRPSTPAPERLPSTAAATPSGSRTGAASSAPTRRAAFSGPYPSSAATPGSTDPGTIVTAANGYVYMAAAQRRARATTTRSCSSAPAIPTRFASSPPGSATSSR